MTKKSRDRRKSNRALIADLRLIEGRIQWTKLDKAIIDMIGFKFIDENDLIQTKR